MPSPATEPHSLTPTSTPAIRPISRASLAAPVIHVEAVSSHWARLHVTGLAKCHFTPTSALHRNLIRWSCPPFNKPEPVPQSHPSTRSPSLIWFATCPRHTGSEAWTDPICRLPRIGLARTTQTDLFRFNLFSRIYLAACRCSILHKTHYPIGFCRSGLIGGVSKLAKPEYLILQVYEIIHFISDFIKNDRISKVKASWYESPFTRIIIPIVERSSRKCLLNYLICIILIK